MVLCCRLVKGDMSCRKVQLLTYWERGSLYQQLKARFQGDWMRVCREEFQICSQTVNRYITFYELVGAYPRIVICELTFDTIMYCKAAIVEELDKDVDLGLRFRVPLREVSIIANMSVEGEAMPVVDYDPPTEHDVANWDAGWELSDAVLDDD